MKIPIELRTVSGSQILNYELITQTPLEFNENTTMSWKVMNLNNKNFDAILGLNVLRPIGAVVDLLNGQFEVNSTIIKFNYVCPYIDTICQLEAITLNQNELFCKINTTELNPEETKILKTILMKNEDLFYKEGDTLTCVNAIKHQIITTSSQPIHSKIYRFPKIHEEEVNRQIQEMLAQDIIQPSFSPYNSPIWVVPKKLDNSGEKKWRIVVDYRKLNEITTSDKFPIPNIDSLFDKLGRSQYFSTIDLAKGFHQILVDEKDRTKTAFSTPQGHFEFKRMPFGLKNAPATFQRMINFVLQKYINKTCVVYLDDILIFSTSLQEHIEAINNIFKELRKYNLKIQIDKCNFFSRSTEYLGHILTPEGIKPNEKKIEVIKNIKLPTTQKQIKSFLGITGFYRKFIKDYAKVAQNMTKYLKKNRKINLQDPLYKESFEKLKNMITSYPILRYPDFKRQFELVTDASDFAIGAVLQQGGHPVGFASRTLNDHEINYAVIEKELLSVIWATKYFRPYLYGTKFHLKTDHQPLVWLNSLKEPNAKLQRWRLRLNEYEFDVEYIKGKDNKVADFLSRINVDKCEINNLEDNESGNTTINSGTENLGDHIPIADRIVNKYQSQIILVKEKETEFVLKYKTYRQIFISENELSDNNYLNDVLRRYVKKGITGIFSDLEDQKYNLLQQKIIELFSNNKNFKFWKCTNRAVDLENEEDALRIIEQTHKETNHRGIVENYNEIQNEYFYPKIKELIHKFINNCDACNLAKYDRNPNKYKFEITETPSGPNEIVHGDIFYCYGEKFISLLDKFSKHLMVQRLNDRNSVTIIQNLRHRFSIFGKPKKIIFDNEFDCLNIKDFLRLENIEVHFTSPRSHTGNSPIERVHGTLNEHLRILDAEKSNLTPIEKVLFATEKYNSTIHSVTRVKPIDFINNKITDLDSIKKRLEDTKNKTIEKLNESRINFVPHNDDKVLVENPDAVRHKHRKKYVKLKTKLVGDKIKDPKGKNIHPSRIKRKFKFVSEIPSTQDNRRNIDENATNTDPNPSTSTQN